jgi:hypothetical protein
MNGALVFLEDVIAHRVTGHAERLGVGQFQAPIEAPPKQHSEYNRHNRSPERGPHYDASKNPYASAYQIGANSVVVAKTTDFHPTIRSVATN